MLLKTIIKQVIGEISWETPKIWGNGLKLIPALNKNGAKRDLVEDGKGEICILVSKTLRKLITTCYN